MKTLQAVLIQQSSKLKSRLTKNSRGSIKRNKLLKEDSQNPSSKVNLKRKMSSMMASISLPISNVLLPMLQATKATASLQVSRRSQVSQRKERTMTLISTLLTKLSLSPSLQLALLAQAIKQAVVVTSLIFSEPLRIHLISSNLLVVRTRSTSSMT